MAETVMITQGKWEKKTAFWL